MEERHFRITLSFYERDQELSSTWITTGNQEALLFFGMEDI